VGEKVTELSGDEGRNVFGSCSHGCVLLLLLSLIKNSIHTVDIRKGLKENRELDGIRFCISFNIRLNPDYKLN